MSRVPFRLALLWVFLAMVPLPLDGAEPFNPHKIPTEQFAKQIRVIALRPVALPWDTQQAETVTARIEALIGEALRAKGYVVIAANEHERLWRQLSERAGGAYDPITGKADEKKLEVIRSHTARELERLHDVDAILVPWIRLDSVLPGNSPWTGEMQLWGEPVVFHGQNPRGLPQRLVVSKLAVRIEDVNGIEIYDCEAGLEWRRVYVARGYDVKPPEQSYSDAKLRHTLGLVFDLMVPCASGGS